jgi:hypothetical protein
MSKSSLEHPTTPFLNLSKQELIVQIGLLTMEERGLNIVSPDLKKIKQATKVWFEENISTIRNEFCRKNRDNILSIVNSRKSAAAAAVFDIISTVLSGYPVALASVYLVEFGIEEFCKSTDDKFFKSLE